MRKILVTLLLFLALLAPRRANAQELINWALLTYGGTCSAEYTWDGETPDKAFDDNLNTYWQSGRSTAKTALFRTLDQERLITQIEIVFWSSPVQDRYWEVYYRNSAGSWVLINSGKALSVPGPYCAVIPCSVSAREWRIVVWQSVHWTSIAEWRLLGPHAVPSLTVTAVAHADYVRLLITGTPPFQIYRNEQLIGETSELEYLDYDYPPGALTTYTVRDASRNTGYATVLCCPAAPVVHAAAGITDVTLTWDPVPSATNYRVYRDRLLVANTTQCSYHDTYLAPDTTFHYGVEAVNASGPGKPGSVVVTTMPEPPPPEAPAELWVVNLGGTWAEIGWTPVTGASHYRVYLNGVFHGTASACTYRFTGLIPSTYYVARVQALSEYGEGEVSQAVTFTTLSPPGAVRNLRASPGPDRVLLEWDPPSDGGPVAEYRIRRDGELYHITTATQFLDTGLTVNHGYIYHVSASNDAGEGPLSVIEVTTLDVPIPTTPAITHYDVTARTIALWWDPVPFAERYEIRVAEQVYNTTETHIRITGLTPATNYTLYLTAHNIAGASAPAELIIGTQGVSLALYVGPYGSGFLARWCPSSSYILDAPDMYKVYADGIAVAELSTTQFGMQLNWSPETTHIIRVEAFYAETIVSAEQSVTLLPAAPDVASVVMCVSAVVRGLWPLLALVTAITVCFGVWDILRRWGL